MSHEQSGVRSAESGVLPAQVLAMLADAFGPERAARIVAGFSAARPASFRVNLRRTTAAELVRELEGIGLHPQPHALADGAFTLPKAEEYALKGSAPFTQGRLYCQALASQAAVWCAPPGPAARVLDACAAPGGKTTHLAMLAAGGRVLACERSAVRFQRLRHTIALQGAANVQALHTDVRSPPLKAVQGGFDHVLVDPPCSGTGTLRGGDARTWAHLAEDYDGYVTLKVQQQVQILARCAALVRPGGTLVYATCSLDPREDEAVVDGLLRAEAAFELVDLAPWRERIAATSPGLPGFRGAVFDARLHQALRIDPSHETEGFFVAVLRRNADQG